MSAQEQELKDPQPELIYRRKVPRAGAKEIDALAEGAQLILQDALTQALEPAAKKILRKWNKTEVAEMLGISAKTLDRGIEEGKFPKGERTTARAPVMFTLQEINAMRAALGILPWRNPATDPAKVIAIANFKGGVAKTSVAVHLAQYSARKGLRTLLIDLDAQGSATTMFGFRPDAEVLNSQTVHPWLSGPEYAAEDWTGTLATAIQHTHWPGLDLIAANLRVYSAEFDLFARRMNNQQFYFYRVLDEGLASIKAKYDVIVLDTPPSLSLVTSNALFAADGIVMPVPPAMMDFASSVSFFKLLAELIAIIDITETSPKLFDFLAILVSKYEASNANQVAIHDWLRQAFARRVLQHPMGRSAVIRLGSDIKTAYEIERYDGHRATLARALEFMDGVNEEIIQLVYEQWPSKQAAQAIRDAGGV
jgi:chromosome partitioning protein